MTGENPPQLPNLLKQKTSDGIAWGNSGKSARYLHELRKCLGKTSDRDRKILLLFAHKVARGKSRVA